MDKSNPRHRAYIADASRESAKAMRQSAAVERARGNHAAADEDERIAGRFDAKAARMASN